MKIATWNVNGISSRLDHVIRWCQAALPDVLCLQETKIVDPRFPVGAFREIGYGNIEVFGEKSYNGVAIVSRLPLEQVHHGFPNDPSDSPRRIIGATIRGVRVVNVYVPHGTKLESEKFKFKLDWIFRLRRYLDAFYRRDDLLLLCGDLNVAPHETDVWNPRLLNGKLHFTRAEREAIQELKKWGFVDVFRQMNDEPGEYSWWDTFRESSFAKNRGLRIDHIWATEPLADFCIDCWIDREPRGWEKPSDHAPVVVEISH